jgi:hypothetical protein
MLFGMSNRAGWNGHDPNHNADLWKLWDEFGIENADLYGWWNKSSPIALAVVNSTASPMAAVTSVVGEVGAADVYASAYVRPGHTTGGGTLIALASWSDNYATIRLSVTDWGVLGLKKGSSLLKIPGIESFNRINKTQTIHFPPTGDPLAYTVVFTIPPHQGVLVVLEEPPQ